MSAVNGVKPVSVLFVCLGNICRSPTAQGVFQQVVDTANLRHLFQIDSAGTGDWHVGKPPDGRAQSFALTRGYDLRGLRARVVTANDFNAFDYILAMDRDNLANLQSMKPNHCSANLGLLLDFGFQSIAKSGHREVPDPYYGGDDGFERVLDLITDAAQGLLEHIRRHHLDL